MLKGAIFSLHDVLVKQGSINGDLLEETLRLLRYLRARGVEPVFISNHDWTVSGGGKEKPFRSLLEERLGSISYFIGGSDGMPYKPRADSTAHILAAKGWQKSEVLYVGNTADDMRTAANGGLMFVNALWHGVASPYGFQFESPRDVARFIDCLCLGLTGWFWALEQGDLRVYALAPFTTLSPRYAQAHAYSENAKATSKRGTGDANFWGRLLAARIYFSGLANEIDYITAYPGHAPISNETVIAEALNILGQSLRKSYLPDLILRHAMPPLWWGVAVATVGSAILGAILVSIGGLGSLWEGWLALAAVVLVLSCTIHLIRHGRTMKAAIIARIDLSTGHTGNGAALSVFLFAVLMIGREGSEAAAMIASLVGQTDGTTMIIGGISGLLLAVALGSAWIRYGRTVDLTLFFNATAVFMVLFSLQLGIYALHEFAEASALPWIDNAEWHMATEPYGPDGEWGRLLSYSLVVAPALLLAWARIRAIDNRRRTDAFAETRAARSFR